jgi:hypothetical protein
MDIKFCSECRRGFSAAALPISGVCADCERKHKSDVMVLHVFKWICFSLAIICFALLLPALLARETSYGYYEIPGSKNGPHIISKTGLMTLVIIGLVGPMFFGGVGWWLKIKQSKKQYNVFNDDLSIK